jgi:hypothetical protein
MALSDRLQPALADSVAWRELVVVRLPQLTEFLTWAAAQEAGGRSASLRLENRDDLERCTHVLPLFAEPWWGVVVYSCFDSVTGAEIAATFFREPLLLPAATTALAEPAFRDRGLVQFHRAQSTLTGAKRSLLSACEKADDIREVLFLPRLSFDGRFARLMEVDVSWWGRTTCFDALLRAGSLGVSGHKYRPDKSYLLGSTGPAAGFFYLWGERVTKSNADDCEDLLRHWTARWDEIADLAGVPWIGEPYDSGDFENALCVFQETLGSRHSNSPAQLS